MSDEFSVRFGPALAAWAKAEARGPMREKVDALRAAYHKGENSAEIDVAAYVAVRAPATFAAISSVLSEVTRLVPNFAPLTMADIGAGPGTASFAAASHFPTLRTVEMIEADPRFAALANSLSQGLPFNATVHRQLLMDELASADLVVAAYVLAELPQDFAPEAALHLWQRTNGTLVLVEPGTPSGFSRIKAAREALLKQGAMIVGPCTHAEACPMEADNWCHFKVRLQRNRAHMHAKTARVPFEDEAYSWVAFTRLSVRLPEARILAPPKTNKAGIALSLCSASGLQDVVIASRDKAPYKRARKLKWGDGFSRSDDGAP